MSKITRKLIRSEPYEGRTIEARWMGPDLLCFVTPAGGGTGTELGSFYIDAQAAIDGGQRYIDADIKAAQERVSKDVRGRSA
jgi:hypothetical protein